MKRDFQALIDDQDQQVKRLGRDLMRPTKAMFRHWARYRDGTITRRGFERLMKPIRREVEALLLRGLFSGNARLMGMCQELYDHRDWLWAFVEIEGLEPTNNEGELPAKLGKTPAELPEKLAPLGKTNGARFQSLVAAVVAMILSRPTKGKGGPVLLTRFVSETNGLLLLVHRRLRLALHAWLTDKIEAIKTRDIPKEIDEEFARGCQQQFSDQANGNHDTSWSCYYDFLLNVCGVKEVEPLKGLLDLAQACGWWTPLRWVAILQHRPAELHCDSEGRLHRDGGPVVRFRDGFAFWILHGVPVPKEIAETNSRFVASECAHHAHSVPLFRGRLAAAKSTLFFRTD